MTSQGPDSSAINPQFTEVVTLVIRRRQFARRRWLPPEPEELKGDTREIAETPFPRTRLLSVLCLRATFFRHLLNVCGDELNCRQTSSGSAEAGALPVPSRPSDNFLGFRLAKISPASQRVWLRSPGLRNSSGWRMSYLAAASLQTEAVLWHSRLYWYKGMQTALAGYPMSVVFQRVAYSRRGGIVTMGLVLAFCRKIAGLV